MSELKAHRFLWVSEIPLKTTIGKEYYLKDDVDKVIAGLEESHKKEVGQLLMEISGLKKLVETADKIIKPKGGFTVKDIAFNGVKLEGLEKEVK